MNLIVKTILAGLFSCSVSLQLQAMGCCSVDWTATASNTAPCSDNGRIFANPNGCDSLYTKAIYYLTNNTNTTYFLSAPHGEATALLPLDTQVYNAQAVFLTTNKRLCLTDCTPIQAASTNTDSCDLAICQLTTYLAAHQT